MVIAFYLPMIYFLQASTKTGPIKIGFARTLGRIQARFESHRCGSPVPLIILGVMQGTLRDEHELHTRFRSNRSHLEWFFPSTELRTLIARRSVTVEQARKDAIVVPYDAEWEQYRDAMALKGYREPLKRPRGWTPPDKDPSNGF